MFSYTEKLRFTSTTEIGAHLKYFKSSLEKSFGKLSIAISSPGMILEILETVLINPDSSQLLVQISYKL